MTTTRDESATGKVGRLAAVKAAISRLPHPVRVAAVATVGGVLVLAGAAMLVLPGPGIVVILAGLAVLASEFVWARRALEKAKDTAKAGVDAGKKALKKR